MMSRRSRSAGGRHASCTGVGCVKPRTPSACSSSGPNPNPSQALVSAAASDDCFALCRNVYSHFCRGLLPVLDLCGLRFVLILSYSFCIFVLLIISRCHGLSEMVASQLTAGQSLDAGVAEDRIDHVHTTLSMAGALPVCKLFLFCCFPAKRGRSFRCAGRL